MIDVGLELLSFGQGWRLDPRRTTLGVKKATPVTKYSDGQ